MDTYRSGSLWSNTLVFVLVILFLIGFASAKSAKSATSATNAQSNNSPNIPVTGGTHNANLSQPGGRAGAQSTPKPLTGAYTVQAGDTLDSIALRFYTTVDALLRANPQISHPDLLVAGETLYIPGSTVDIDGQTIYIVESGDDLFAIAASHNVTLDALEQANPKIQPPRLIFPGQWVEIP